MAKRQPAKVKVMAYKPLLYTTTIRNPERYKDFMHILKRFDGQVLTDNVVELFERELFKVGLYRPRHKPETVIAKWASTQIENFSDTALTDEQTKLVYDANDPKLVASIKGHKEAGFDRGWQSRFNTQMALMKSLGFVYYAMGEPIQFSETGSKLAASVSIEVNGDVITHNVEHPEYEQAAFLQAFAKQQRCNPFIRELNDNIPLILLLQVIRLLNADSDYNDCGISYKEIPLLLFWKDNDATALYRCIKSVRATYGYNPSPEVIEKACLDIIGTFKAFKLKSIVSEYPDEFIRKMRMTGLISFRGGGRFVDINHNEDAKIDYIISHYSHYEKYTDPKAYFDYMASIDTNLFNINAVRVSRREAEEKVKLWAVHYGWKKITQEVIALSKRSPSRDDVLKFLPQPARLEFLTAIAIKSQLPNVTVIPNYSCDDDGLPTSTAGGNKGDIECYEHRDGILVEVTMAEGRTQTMMEIWPIERHLTDFSKTEGLLNAQCVFVAPSVYSDSVRQIQFVRADKGEVIRPYSIDQFVEYLEISKTLYDTYA